MTTNKTINRSKLKNIQTSDSVQDIFEKCINNMLVCIGDDPDREGLRRTPHRVFKAWAEIFEGVNYTNDEIANMYNVCFEDINSNDLVVEGHIPIYSMCEHHLLPMYNAYVSVGYIPNGKVIGLSKIARIAEMCAKRPQLQERIGTDIAEVLQKVLDTEDVIVVIEGEHACMTMRGVKKPGTVTRTAAMRGRFDSNHALRSEFYDLIRK